MQGDLLKGEGAQLIGFSRPTVADRQRTPAPPGQGRRVALRGRRRDIEDMQVVATVEDGLGDYVTWLKNANDELWICNASGDAKLYGFEPVDQPLNDGAEAGSCTETARRLTPLRRPPASPLACPASGASGIGSARPPQGRPAPAGRLSFYGPAARPHRVHYVWKRRRKAYISGEFACSRQICDTRRRFRGSLARRIAGGPECPPRTS